VSAKVGPRLHGPAKGASRHGEDCQCPRCVGFTPGPNGTGVQHAPMTHGARSLVQIQGRTSEVADNLREALVAEGIYRPAFDATLAACAVVLVRIERMAARLDAEDAGEVAPTNERHADQLRQWTNTLRGYLGDLGLTPRSHTVIARDTGLASYTRTKAAMRELEAHLAAEHSDGE
jgi:hypothetical protein